MVVRYFTLFVLLSTGTKGSDLYYTFNDIADGWLKLYDTPAVWADARTRCDTEGANLASPLVYNLRDAIKSHVHSKNGSINTIYTGVQAEFEGGDFLSVEGYQISDLPVPLLTSKPNDYKSPESCIVWDIEGKSYLRKVKCDDMYPYVCYKKRTHAMLPVGPPPKPITVPLSPEPETGHGTRDPETDSQQGSQTYLRTLTDQRHYPKCSIDGTSLLVVNSELTPKVMTYIANNPTMTIIFADTAQIYSKEQSTWRLLIQRSNNTHRQPLSFNGTAQQRQGSQNNTGRPGPNRPTESSRTPSSQGSSNQGSNNTHRQPSSFNGTAQQRQGNQSNTTGRPGSNRPTESSRTPSSQGSSNQERPNNTGTSQTRDRPSPFQRIQQTNNVSSVTPSFGSTQRNQGNVNNTGRQRPNSPTGSSTIPQGPYEPNGQEGLLPPQKPTQPTFLPNPVSNGYIRVSKADGRLKMHMSAETWESASNRCASEGAVLASPLTADLRDAINGFVLNMSGGSVTKFYTGVHANIATGDYYSVEGVLLKKMPVSLDTDLLTIYHSSATCIVMSTTGSMVTSTKCTDIYPYVCYKKSVAVRGCGTKDPEYKYEPTTKSCYKFHNRGQTWIHAYSTCKNEGGYLVIVNSEEESTAIKKLFNEHKGSTIIGYYRSSVYVGRRDWRNGKSWVTVKGDSIQNSGFIGWAASEPNNAHGDEYCGTMDRLGQMFDDPCTLKLAFICEKESELLYNQDDLDNPTSGR